MVTCYVALGSNQGDRRKNIALTLRYLRQDPEISLIRVSSVIETQPDQSPSPEKFLNAAIKLQTSYSAQELLSRLQQIEIRLGRSLPRLKNQPRAIDLDILLYGKKEINRQGLQIPHPKMWERDFVKIPLKEIAPELF